MVVPARVGPIINRCFLLWSGLPSPLRSRSVGRIRQHLYGMTDPSSIIGLQSAIAAICARALSPTEVSLHRPGGELVRQETDEAKFLFDRWEKRLGMFKSDGNLFAKRLDYLQLDRKQAHAWLTPAAPDSHFTLPTWGVLLAEVVGASVEAAPTFPLTRIREVEQRTLFRAAQVTNRLPTFADFLHPFLSACFRRLKLQVPEADSLLEPEAWEALARFVLDSLSATAARTLAHEVKEHSRQGALEGQTPENRLEDFQTRYLGSTAGRLALFQKYPVLARILAWNSLTIADTVAELLNALEKDRTKLAETFNEGKALGPIVTLRLGLSDPHRGGRTVMVIETRDGLRLVYKPRALQLTAVFNALIAWWNERELRLQPPPGQDPGPRRLWLGGVYRAPRMQLAHRSDRVFSPPRGLRGAVSHSLRLRLSQ